MNSSQFNRGSIALYSMIISLQNFIRNCSVLLKSISQEWRERKRHHVPLMSHDEVILLKADDKGIYHCGSVHCNFIETSKC